MRRLIGAGVFGVVLLITTCMSTVYVEPGNVGVVVHKVGGGVDKVAVGPGFHWRNPLATNIEEYPVKMMTVVLAKSSAEGSANNDEINVNDKRGQPISLDVSYSFELDPTLTPVLYTTFRTDIETIAHTYIKNTVRQALQETVGTEDVADVIGPKKGEVITLAQGKVSTALQPFGIKIRQFTLNEVRPPATYVAAVQQKNQIVQEAEAERNRLQKITYKAQQDSIEASGQAKAIMAVAQAKADAARLLNGAGGSPQYLRLLELENQKAAIARWNGDVPTYVMGGQAIPFINLTPGAAASSRP